MTPEEESFVQRVSDGAVPGATAEQLVRIIRAQESQLAAEKALREKLEEALEKIGDYACADHEEGDDCEPGCAMLICQEALALARQTQEKEE